MEEVGRDKGKRREKRRGKRWRELGLTQRKKGGEGTEEEALR